MGHTAMLARRLQQSDLAHAWTRAVRGFTIIELLVALSISAILAVYANYQLILEAELDQATAAGTTISTVANAAQNHVALNWNAYANGSPVPGTANPLQPTTAELVALGRLPVGFPTRPGALSTKQDLQINITKTGCPGAGCLVRASVCTTTPVTMGRPVTPENIRWDLVGRMVSTQNGAGAMSKLGSGGATISGAQYSYPNPFGAQEGIVCGSSSVDMVFYQQFVRVNDTRDPNLQGPLTVAGAITGQSTLAVTGAVTASNTMVVGGPLSANNSLSVAGPVTAGSDVTATGNVKGAQLVPTSFQSLGAACNNEGAVAKSNVGLLWCNGGLWRDLVSVAADGVACAIPGQPARDAMGAEVVCVGGKYRSVSKFVRDAVAGSACSPRGVIAYDFSAATPSALLCRANPSNGTASWAPLEAVTTNLVFGNSVTVTDGASVAAPVCSYVNGVTATALIYLIPQSWAKSSTLSANAAPTGGFSALSSVTISEGMQFSATGTGPWSVRIKAADGTSATSAVAIAETYCYYQ